VNKWASSLVKNVARVEQLRMFAGSWFQAEGAATENERSARWRLERGTMKSPREVDRRRVSRHGSQSSVIYDGAAPWTTRYIKQHSLYCYQGSGKNLGNWELASDVDAYEKVNHHANSWGKSYISLLLSQQPFGTSFSIVNGYSNSTKQRTQ